jgi:hypothetical protein
MEAEKPRRARSDAQPCETPAEKPASFCTGRFTAKLTERTVDVNVVDRRFEHAAQAELAVVTLVLDFVEDVGGVRSYDRLELAVARRHPHGDVARVRIGPAEDGVEGELEVLEVLDRQVEADRESAEHEVRDAVELGLARQRERDLVSHESSWSL